MPSEFRFDVYVVSELFTVLCSAAGHICVLGDGNMDICNASKTSTTCQADSKTISFVHAC